MKLFPFIIACLLLPVLTLAYSGTLSIGDVATEGISTTYDAIIAGSTLATSGNNSNYSVSVRPYVYDVEKHIVVIVDDDDDSSSSSGGGSSSSYFSFTGYEEIVDDPVVVSSSFSSFGSSINGSLTVKSPKDDTAITTLIVKVVDEQENIQVRVVETAGEVEREELISFSGSWYKLVDVEHEALPSENIDEVDFSFRVTKGWLEDVSIDADDVLLFRYEQGAWSEYDTLMVDSDEYYYYFSSVVPGLSTFLIGSYKTGVVVDQDIEEVNETVENEVTGNVVDDSTTPVVSDDSGDPYAPGKDKGNLNTLIFVVVLVVVGGGIGVVVYLKKNNLSTADKEKVIMAAGSGSETPGAWIETTDKALGQARKDVAATQEPITDEQSVQEMAKNDAVQASPSGLFNNNDEELLTNFLVSLQQKGIDLNQYKVQLLQRGWTQEQIDYCINKLVAN